MTITRNCHSLDGSQHIHMFCVYTNAGLCIHRSCVYTDMCIHGSGTVYTHNPSLCIHMNYVYTQILISVFCVYTGTGPTQADTLGQGAGSSSAGGL